MPRAALPLAVLLWTTAASAEQPPLRPSRDVEVTYRAVAPQGGGRVVEERVRWLAAAQTMRIDPPSPGLYVIIDYLARRMSVVRDTTRSVVEMAAPDNMTGMVGGTATDFARGGEATVAGQACTEWQTLDREGRPVTVCMTADGVLMRAATADRVRVSAVSVRYGPQDPEAFRVPADYTRHSPRASR